MVRRPLGMFFSCLVAFSVLLTASLSPSGGAANRALVRLLLRSGEQPGYSVSGKTTTSATAASFIATSGVTGKQKASFTTELKGAGFIVATGEQLSAPGEVTGFSLVLEFQDAAGASEWVSDELRLIRDIQGPSTILSFKVPGIGSAKGVLSLNEPVATVNAFWSDDRCVLGAGVYLPNATGYTPAGIEKPVIQGIKAQSRRIGVRCP